MIEQLKSDLLQDQILAEANKHRRKRQRRGILAVMVPLVIAVFVLWPSFEPEVIAGTSVPVDEPEPFVTLNTDEELLDSLAHLGPVIVTREDGSQWLYLTNQ